MKAADEATEAEGEVVVRVEAKTAGATISCSSMEWTAKTSNDASTQARCNRWALKENPTSPRSVHSTARKDTVTSNNI